ncbi:response regulator transcription factor [Viridibacillus sp. YIM B01967]|uniref:Response regulator transcription factor n=1 Tax=Viridibacillus soli TaxID=2798301 RepID=A0ABS1HDS2_9BACL|nr:response regulator transcription factor [Viridibacillus soli]MBK3497399.1 response regulator transcription factor [Viridibacillus soli]
MKILIAEDDDRLRKNIVHMIKREIHQVEAVDNGQDALDYAQYNEYDLLILDWMMPKLSGIDVCKEVRKRGYTGGILMLTARDDTADIIQGLDIGADDYLVKPVKMEELLARVRALLRRKDKPIEQVIQVEGFLLQLDSRILLRNNEAIELTKKEFLLLEYLFINKGRVLTRDQISLHIWGYDQDISNNALDALVKLVRKKIDENKRKSIIQNVRGIGYKLRDSYV